MTGIGIDYSNICKDYNTAYLDRDNNDRATTGCMKQVMTWSSEFLEDMLAQFGYRLFPLNADVAVTVADVASKRFLFFSLEKEITLQSFVAQKEPKAYDTPADWAEHNRGGVLIQNDEDGEGIYLYIENDSEVHRWITVRLEYFSLEEVPFPAK